MNILCICSYFKGIPFIIQQAQLGNRVFLITCEKRKHEEWPWAHIAETYYLPDEENTTENLALLKKGFGWLLQTENIDVIVALDDFDVEKAAFLRSSFQIEGMDIHTAQLFRDKLAMRKNALKNGIPVPRFCPLFNDKAVYQFMKEVEGPWIIKPRSQASTTGIRKVLSFDEVALFLQDKGESRVDYLLEEFIPGHVFHCDTLSYNSDIVFEKTSRYLETPLKVAHEGGIFKTITLPEYSLDNQEILAMNRKLLQSFQLKNGASHSEFIKADKTGKIYFLETSARVGGAHIAELLEAATGIDIWKEWANIENAVFNNEHYSAPEPKSFFAGLVISLAKIKHPDISELPAEHLYWTLKKDFHIGMVFRSELFEEIIAIMEKITPIIKEKFHASAPTPEKPTD
jgi:biotin carboxylase